jgi:hypothetical protein
MKNHAQTHRQYANWTICGQIIRSSLYYTRNISTVLYGCKTWSLILKEEYRYESFENKVLRKIHGAKREEVMSCMEKITHKEDP